MMLSELATAVNKNILVAKGKNINQNSVRSGA